MWPMGDEPGAHATALSYFLTLSFGPGAAVMIGAPVCLEVQWRDLKKCHVGAEYWSWGLNVEAVVMAERHALWESVSACAKRQKVAIRALPGVA